MNNQRSGSRQQQSCGICLITMESITKQKPMSGRKIVGSAAEGLISILYCTGAPPPPQLQPRSKRMTAEGEGVQRWKRGCRGPDGGCRKSRKTASQRRARCGGEIRAETVKSGGMRGLGSSSTANPHLHVELMKTKRLRRNPV